MAYIGRTPTGSILTGADIADGSISTAKLADTAVSTAKIADNSITTAKTAFNDIPFRNLIINGDMSIAQRGTSASSSGSGYHCIDRMNIFCGIGTHTFSQSTTVPTGQGFVKSFKVDCTTAEASPSASDVFIFGQKLEGQMLQMLKKGTSNAESVTISFWVRSNKTGTYTLEIQDLDNTRQISKTYTIDSADTWEKKTINYDGDTTGVFDNDNANSCQINWWIGAGSNFTSGTLNTSWASTTNANRVSSSQVNIGDNTSNEWYITGVQLEVGTSASDFDFIPYDVNLKRCQRYFETFPSNGGDGVIGYGYGSGSDTARTMFPFKVTKRSAPTMSDSLSSSRQYRINFTATDGTAVNQNSTSTPSFGTISTLNSGYMNLSGFSNIGGGHNGFLIYNNNTTLLSADAEL